MQLSGLAILHRTAHLSTLRDSGQDGVPRGVTLYTLLETAKLHGIDPAAYLHAAVLVLAADDGRALLPWDFAAANRAAEPAT